MKQLQTLQTGKFIRQKRLLFKSTRWLLTIFVSLLMLHAAATVRRVYVNVSGGNGSGSSWANAYQDLQSAIDNSSSGDEVWIKSGNYRPFLNSSFRMKSGVKIYGGFPIPGEPQFAERDVDVYKVFLRPANITSGTTYPIVLNNGVSSSALLDGVYFENGQYSNLGSGGAAMSNTGSSFPTISNVAFISNSLGSGNGGALYIEGGNSPITNVTFTSNQCSGNGYGGAIYMKNCTSTLTNVLFNNNHGSSSIASQAGAIYCEESGPTLVNCVFDGNYVDGNGGAVYCHNPNNITRIPRFTNVVFYNNKSVNGSGGAIYCDAATPVIINCTFALNQCGTSNTTKGGGVYTTESAITITNCLFRANIKGTSTTATDIAAFGFLNNNSVTYSSFAETVTFSGTGNTGPVTTPFVNLSDGDGTDNKWMTADDGLRLAYCNAFAVVDKGNSGANTQANDIRGSGFPRKVNLDFVADGGAGFIDMGAYEDQNDEITLISITGSIGTSHTVPFPKELSADTIKSTAAPRSGATLLWQFSTDNTNWNTAPGTNTQAFYILPNISQTTYYRRSATSSAVCGTPFYSNVVKITVILPNGKIKGTITANQSGVGVEGIVVQATRQGTISGSPANYTYSATTQAGGQYEINGIYYSDNDTTLTSNFTVTPVKANHSFNPVSTNKTLSSNSNVQEGVNFKDVTVISVSGRTYQQCAGCNTVTGTPEMQTCPIDSIQIHTDIYGTISYTTTTGFIAPDYGRYSFTVLDPDPVNIKPVFPGHTFSPVLRVVTPIDNVSGIDFNDVTTHTITGKFSDGCGNYIGVAELEFTDILDSANITPRPSCFRKRVTTDGTGIYTITLPARKYSVRVVGFTPAITNSGNPAYIAPADVTDFINTKIPIDSLTRNISTRDTSLNIMYQRPPVIGITGGLSLICNGQFALLRQNESDSFNVRVYQGPISLGCLLSDTSKVRLITNVQQEDQNQELLYSLADTGTRVKIKGGIPNITGNYLKDLFVYFTDKYDREAPFFNRKVLVTGVKSEQTTYTTVSPEVPLVILHDPPGDASSSTWQQSQSISNAVRFYTASGTGVEAWVEAKVGASATVGVGVLTDISVWGTIKGTIGVNASVTSSNEAIITTTTSQNFSTSGNPEVTGNSGDVYIGAALNMIYAIATDISYNPATCMVSSSKRLVMANNGFNTQYIYSEDHIVNTLIPNLKSLAQLQPASAARYLNQVKVWQQVIDNNAENKRRAAFVQNYSFDGSAGPYTNTTTTSSSKTSSLEFAVEVNAQIAAALGFEVAGSGVSGGVNVNFRMETGGSSTNTVTDETVISYTLDDNTPGDFFSVNVKKDPVYNTPVFELAAGTASCPSEPGAQPRDAVFFTTTNPVMQGLNPTNPATFILKVVNTSASTLTNPNDRRTYKLNYVQSSNVANETITIAGSPFQSNSPYILAPLGYLDSAFIPVSITRQNGSAVYSYEGERFTISTACDEDLGKTVAVSAYFTSPCSGITLVQPADGWMLTATGGNQIFVKPGGYTLSGLTSVNLQYSTGTGGNWTDLPPLNTAQLANGFNFDVSSLPDGAYNIRLRLDCNSGTVYSQRATGFIDRRAPQLFGRPTPTDDRYVNGEVISFSYDEKLNTNPNTLQVTMRRLSNNTLIPATASVYENKITIVPNSSIAGLTGDSIRLVISGVNDMYGNVKMMADTIRFTIGTTVAGTGNQALFVTISNPSVYKNNDTATIKITFNLPTPATNDTRVNYTIAGTARYGIDYTDTATYPAINALYAGINGSTGSIRIAAGSKQAVLTLRPIAGDTSLSPAKTIIISAAEGGDYSLGNPTSVTGTLTSEDGISVYTFTGDGNWNIRSNWQNSNMPLTTLVAPKEIIINPSGTCLLNVKQTIKPGAKITVKQNRRMVIQGSLKQQ